MEFRNPDPRFTGPAYHYLRDSDELPTQQECWREEYPLVRVKLFHTASRWTYYAYAATVYEGIDGPVLSGYCVSALGPDCDEMGDQGLLELCQPLGPFGLPVERDLSFRPIKLDTLLERLRAGQHV